ncbi:MAG: SDR family oxidoreductase [Myxococcales bacterium]|nr:SDR family oxidoreductase [Myxococcales bacterium]
MDPQTVKTTDTAAPRAAEARRPLALVTGASRGIGRAVALALAPSHELILTARTSAALGPVTDELGARGTIARTLAADLSRADERAALLEAVAACARELEAPVEVLVNNAGLAHSAPIARTDDDRWATLLAVNLTAPFELCRALVPGMRSRGRGRVVNIASTAALKGYSYTAAYAATKAGLLGMTRSLALELAKDGVTVNAVCPGFTDTDIVAAAVDNITAKTTRSREQARATLAGFSPQGRLRSPDEVATLVAYLASDAAAGITGQALAIDGGETA